MRVKDAVGRFGEQVAVRHLVAQGMAILATNWRAREGELDIVAEDAGELVVVEVKTRSSVHFGAPVEAVDVRKAGRIRRLALQWIEATRDEDGSSRHWSAIRFDVVGVLRTRAGLEINHVRGAF